MIILWNMHDLDFQLLYRIIMIILAYLCKSSHFDLYYLLSRSGNCGSENHREKKLSI